MKIGILTYHWVSNFGANLQALSTYMYLLNMGYDPIVINWIPEDVESKYDNNVLTIQNDSHRQFAKDSFKNITRLCRNGEDIAREIELNRITKVLIGSDAVFTNLPKLARFVLCRRGIVRIHPKSDSVFPNPFWGDFLNYMKTPVEIVALSASAQNMPYKKILFPNEKARYKNALLRFRHITVRDVWTQNMVKFITSGKINPQITPDPVFAFEQNVKPLKIDYVHQQLAFGGRYVLFSGWETVTNSQWILELEKLFESEGVRVIGLPKTTMKVFKSPLKYNLTFPISPLEWYDTIKYSDGYIGELMHPVLVALHNSVPVFSFDTYGFSRMGKLSVKSSKIYQIISRFDILGNYFNRRLNKELPSPVTVYKAIKGFDKNRCSAIAQMMLSDYNKMMKSILSE